MQRQFDPSKPELMDLPQPVSAELRDDLSSIEWLNRTFGACSFLRNFLRKHHADSKSLRILDLATGSADLPRVAVDWARKMGIEIQVDALDFQPSTLTIARERSQSFPEITLHQHDIRKPWLESGYDLVMSFQALHHFSQDDAATVMQEMGNIRAASRLVVDLERSRLATMAIDLLTAVILTAPMSRNDARVSIRRAFSFKELNRLAGAAGWSNIQQSRVFLFRQAIFEAGMV